MENAPEKAEFFNLTKENLADEHICCIIRTKKPHQGIDAKKQWLSERLNDGHIFRKLNAKATVFIEYAPVEKAWVPIIGDNYLYIYCLWVLGEYKGKGYGKELLEYCIADAKSQGKSGVCILGSKRKKTWLTDISFAKKYEFQAVDSTDNGYELYSLSFDKSEPKFADNAKSMTIPNKELTIYYDLQCPYIPKSIEITRKYCEENNIPVSLILVDSLEKAKSLPCVFNNCAIFYNGIFQTVNLPDEAYLKRLIK